MISGEVISKNNGVSILIGVTFESSPILIAFIKRIKPDDSKITTPEKAIKKSLLNGIRLKLGRNGRKIMRLKKLRKKSRL